MTDIRNNKQIVVALQLKRKDIDQEDCYTKYTVLVWPAAQEWGDGSDWLFSYGQIQDGQKGPSKHFKIRTIMWHFYFFSIQVKIMTIDFSLLYF